MREEYQALIDDISASLGTPATLEDRDFTLIAFGAHEGQEGAPDADLDPVRTRSILQRRSTAAVRKWFESFGITRARAPVRIPPDPSAGVRTGRLCIPVRHGGVVYGYVWLLDDGAPALDDPRVARAQQTATRIGALLAAEARAGAHAGELLREVLTGPAGSRAEAAEALRSTSGAVAAAPLAMVAIRPWHVGELRGSASAGPTGIPGVAAQCALPESSALAVLTRLRAAGVLAPAEGVAKRLLAAPSGGGGSGSAGGPGRTPEAASPAGTAAEAFGGVSALRGDLAGTAAAAWEEALVAARAAAAEPERFGRVVAWDAIGPYRLLGRLPAAAAPDEAVRHLFEPGQREMARTAEAFLDRAGQAGRTAADLGIHRQTLYYRLGRVERLTGLRLDDGADRLLLHVALKAARLG
ncbi:PucR family transcriptional regulator [Streptomyces sp. TR02-1]|uniref:PucR family transcriptional regulator n=1 Tax=Streptomyces sp. TR02-1 TaxID=3385977 RepID=UPI0039A3F3E4